MVYIIHKEYVNGEKIMDSEVVGHFDTYEAAEKWLLDKEYTKDSQILLGVATTTYLYEDVFSIIAHITKLERLG